MSNVRASKDNVTNSNATTSLILGILSILIPFIGLALGIFGIIFSRKATREIVSTNMGGHGFATAGLICSIVGIVIQLFGVLSILAFNLMTTVG
ncbi:DUF4190 domain-containing protein [Sporosarcina oncorhynchi]|uniref:DUF4190 domain-containing protein n=1 Tax=Sporosarcina oncorhynchi TaxID=3056444 RepID=A0ABZ0L532_9BACL|nr:DUF4190 domain-containing protein [Sporosarcina sp. T2O-4]WOV86757.1 DUF4190 domain-containing protein [Sporosarcina sp. T2O-4]